VIQYREIISFSVSQVKRAVYMNIIQNPLQFFKRKSFPHGIVLSECKETTSGKDIRRLAFAPSLMFPLSQHIGQPSVPVVNQGQEIVRGELIADADGFMSVPLHASASGIIERIGFAPSLRGPKEKSIIIKPYPGSDQALQPGPERDYEQMSTQEIITAVQEMGMIGLGGAGFPTHVKMTVPAGRSVDTVIVNGCECEPFLTTDHQIMIEQIEHLILGIRIAMKSVKAECAVIGIEDNKLDVLQSIRSTLPTDGNIQIEVLGTKYPQGAEKMLTKALLDREIPSGGLPADIGVVIFNVATLTQIGVLLPRHLPLIERVVTITGPGINKPGNFLAPLGTPIGFILKQLGYSGNVNRVILGGPMMGFAASSMEVPITKSIGGLLVLEKESINHSEKIYPCIKCSKCLQACPISLNPSMLGMLAEKREYEAMASNYHLNDCFECGCCSYVCPSNIPLVQYFRIAKAINQEDQIKAAAAEQ